jgi:hypothetical protein
MHDIQYLILTDLSTPTYPRVSSPRATCKRGDEDMPDASAHSQFPKACEV